MVDCKSVSPVIVKGNVHYSRANGKKVLLPWKAVYCGKEAFSGVPRKRRKKAERLRECQSLENPLPLNSGVLLTFRVNVNH